MKISFVDFWPSPRPLDIFNNFFVHALQACAENIRVVEPSSCEVLFYGPFGQEHRRYRHCLKIFYTGENILPDFNQCHASLSFSSDDCSGRNMRLPLWHLYIDWFGVRSYGNPEWLVPVDWLKYPALSDFSASSKQKFCAIVYGKPIQTRITAIAAISRYRQVDVFGKANPRAPIPDGELAKLQALSPYRFSLCYENSIAEGYHTEKLLHGKIAGGIPIYFGHPSVDLDFNPRCFIQAADLSEHQLVERVREIDSDQRLYRQMVEEPLFLQFPDLGNLCEKLLSFILNQSNTELPCNRPLPFHCARFQHSSSEALLAAKQKVKHSLASLHLLRNKD